MKTPFDLAETDRLLSTTRAVRRRLDLGRPVARETIVSCIRLAQQAPSAENAQNWRWLIIDDADTKRQLADIYARIGDAIRELKSEVPKEDRQNQRVFDSVEYLTHSLHKVPVLVIPCLQERPAPDADHCTVASAFASIIPAVWSFQLALRARGLGSVYTTAHLWWEAEVADILGIPEEVMQVAMLPVAYTLGTEFRPARRPDPGEIIHWNHW